MVNICLHPQIQVSIKSDQNVEKKRKKSYETSCKIPNQYLEKQKIYY